jgi:hypothetical protein
VSVTQDKERRDWSWDEDGELDGMYVETRPVTIRNGPSAGQEKLVFDFHVGADDQLVSIFESAVIRSRFRQELKRRGKPDFEPGERMRIRPTGKKASANGTYRDFAIDFEHAAPKPTTAELLGVDDDEDAEGDDGIPF